MPLVASEQRSPAWFDARKGVITASIAADCLGLGTKSRQWAWRTIKGVEPSTDNKYMEWGREFEARARRDYEVQTGNLVEETGFWIHESIPYLGASPDGLIDGDGCLELFCPHQIVTAVPLYKRIQALVQLMVTGRQWCDFFAWTHNGTFLQRIHRSGLPGLQRRLTEFYVAYVLGNQEPPRKARRKKR